MSQQTLPCTPPPQKTRSRMGVVAMSSSQCVNRGRACIVVNEITPNMICASMLFAKSLFFAHFKIYAVLSSNYGQYYLDLLMSYKRPLLS